LAAAEGLSYQVHYLGQMLYILWEFTVSAKHREEFERAYGSEGVWAELFRKDPAYLQTILIRDDENQQRFVTIDVWEDRNSYASFKERFALEYKKIDQKCETLTQAERHVGAFERI
jgi:quinol monooxygenase YgiN